LFKGESLKIGPKFGGILMYIVCEEHLDQAIDEFVESCGESPDLYLLEEISFSSWSAPTTCQFCEQKSKYLVL
jgi:CxxH/CxxC protein (TIGR04129 family)